MAFQYAVAHSSNEGPILVRIIGPSGDDDRIPVELQDGSVSTFDETDLYLIEKQEGERLWPRGPKEATET